MREYMARRRFKRPVECVHLFSDMAAADDRNVDGCQPCRARGFTGDGSYELARLLAVRPVIDDGREAFGWQRAISSSESWRDPKTLVDLRFSDQRPLLRGMKEHVLAPKMK
jgi:hypothetical protein